MLQKAAVQHREYEPLPSRQTRQHPIFHTAGLDFVVHRANHTSPESRVPPSPGELILWRFRTDWRSIPRDEALSWLSRAELERARHYPNPAMARRFLVGRATLRRILSKMLGCAPRTLVLTDGVDGQPRLFRPEPRRAIRIHVAYAGVWIIVGISNTDLGIGAIMPAPLAHGTESPFESGKHRGGMDALAALLADGHGTPAQRVARQSGLLRLAALGELGTDPTITAEYAAATIIHAAPDQRCHILDLPMPGKIAAAVALPQTISRVDAFGWIKD